MTADILPREQTDLDVIGLLNEVVMKVQALQSCGGVFAEGYFVCIDKGDIVLSPRYIATKVLQANNKPIPTSGPGITRVSSDMDILVPDADIVFKLSVNGNNNDCEE